MKRGKTFNQHLYASTLARILSPRKRHFSSFESGLSAKPRRTFLIKTWSYFFNVYTYELGCLLGRHGDRSTSKCCRGRRNPAHRSVLHWLPTSCRWLKDESKHGHGGLGSSTSSLAAAAAGEIIIIFFKNSITSISCLTRVCVIKRLLVNFNTGYIQLVCEVQETTLCATFGHMIHGHSTVKFGKENSVDRFFSHSQSTLL